jgi:alkanesulfonate monooxygenase SsuD/methylene tetrahydromethanopterin reductase-like flavin-dependent oxidoreductase (luciferase family)
MDDEGTALGVMVRVGMPEAVVRSAARAAEDAGFGGLWCNNPPGQDGLTPIAWAAGASARIALGTGVVPVSHHAPDEILRRIEELRVPRERYRLGVGSGQGAHPVDRVRAALWELRPVAGCELVLGALGPRMCALAGAEADAALLNAVTPAHARRSAEVAAAGASTAGRPAPRIYAGVLIGLGADGAARLEQAAAFYARLPFYVAHFERMGVTPADVSIAARDVGELAERLAAWRGVVDELTVMGPAGPDHPEAVLRLIEHVQAAWSG